MQRLTSGLTLIEVLIALAIISIALSAVIKASSQNIRSTHYVQDKTIAVWIGENVIKSARLGLIPVPLAPDHLQKRMTVLNRDWVWTAQQTQTPNMRINKIAVEVYANTKEDDSTPILSMDSFVYRDKENG